MTEESHDAFFNELSYSYLTLTLPFYVDFIQRGVIINNVQIGIVKKELMKMFCRQNLENLKIKKTHTHILISNNLTKCFDVIDQFILLIGEVVATSQWINAFEAIFSDFEDHPSTQNAKTIILIEKRRL